MRDSFGSYISTQELENAQANGICRQTIKSRLYAGWTAQKAISISPIRQSEEYRRFRGVAMQNGISSDTYKRRVQRGWELERAATTPLVDAKDSLSRGRENRWATQRVIPKELVETAAENGICYGTLYYRFYASSLIPHDEIATRPPMTKSEQSDKMYTYLFEKR